MSSTRDAVDLLDLDAGERVLWQGRAAVGAAWPSFRRLGIAALPVIALALAAWGGPSPSPLDGLALLLFGLTALAGGALVVVAASKLLGPSYLLITWTLVTAPALSLSWVERVQRLGWAAALERTDAAAAVGGFLFVAVPLGLLSLDVLERLGTAYVVTTGRVSAVWAPFDRVLWQRRLDLGDGALRVERTWREPDGCLVLGPRRLRLRDDDPERVLALVRALREEPPA